MKLIAGIIAASFLAAAQERPAILRPTESELKLSVSALSADRHKWPTPPAPAAAAKPESQPAPTLSAEERQRLIAALARLEPTGRLIWDADLKQYLPEFRSLAKRGITASK